ncbi:MAG: type II toxin-antitoxin system VapC family toxin [Myxococcales bacterium]|nr:type II toxin-antitoxin system VapC family toxin [Myxococcales bacterium]
MKFLLDTNACIGLVARRQPLTSRIECRPATQFRMSSITLAELEHGAARSADRSRNRRLIHQLTREIRVEPFTAAAARGYGEIRAALEARGQPIGPMDLLIAAHCKTLGLAIITDNVGEFSRVPGLSVENWLR